MERTLLAFMLALASGPAMAATLYEDRDTALTIGGHVGVSWLYSDSDSSLQDSSSRINFALREQFLSDWALVGKAEWGFQTISRSTSLVQRGDSLEADRDDFFFNRLGYVGAEHDDYGQIRLGKQWSVYYDITEVSDWFITTGGFASGTYNFNTDGGISGTGRADSAIVYRNVFGPFKLGLQYQANSDSRVEIIPEDCITDPDLPFCDTLDLAASYDDYYGASLVFEWQGWRLGGAYNTGDYEFVGTDVQGIDGDSDDALAISLAYGQVYEPGPYIGLVAVETKRHEVDNNGVLFDSLGYELFASWSFDNRFTLVGGFNWLESDDDEYEQGNALSDPNGEFLRRFYVVGVHYLWASSALLYAEAKLDDSEIGVDNNAEEDAYGLGVRLFF